MSTVNQCWFSCAVLLLFCTYVTPSAIIGNGYIVMGVDDYGQLNIVYPYGSVISGTGGPGGRPWEMNDANVCYYGVGIRLANYPSEGDFCYTAVEAGCFCELWGLLVPDFGISGWVGNAADNVGLTLVSFTGTNGGYEASSVVTIGSGKVRVTHTFRPSAVKYIMEVSIRIENLSDEDFPEVQYRRAMDWDIHPTEYSEYVSVVGGQGHPAILTFCSNGFITGAPGENLGYPCLSGCSTLDTDYVQCGPYDHGAFFDITLGAVPAGGSKIFTSYYGAAPTVEALLGPDGAGGLPMEVASIGQSSGCPGACEDAPSFIWGFGSITGNTLYSCPPDITILLSQAPETTLTGSCSGGTYVDTIISSSPNEVISRAWNCPGPTIAAGTGIQGPGTDCVQIITRTADFTCPPPLVVTLGDSYEPLVTGFPTGCNNGIYSDVFRNSHLLERSFTCPGGNTCTQYIAFVNADC